MSATDTTEQAIAHLAASVPADASDTSRALVALAQQVADLRDELQRTRRRLLGQADECWQLVVANVREENIADHCRQQAQIWKQEARTANDTIAECYRAVTGGTGEPGTWRGARPVVECIEQLRAELAEVRAERDALRADLVGSWPDTPDEGLWPDTLVRFGLAEAVEVDEARIRQCLDENGDCDCRVGGVCYHLTRAGIEALR